MTLKPLILLSIILLALLKISGLATFEWYWILSPVWLPACAIGGAVALFLTLAFFFGTFEVEKE